MNVFGYIFIGPVYNPNDFIQDSGIYLVADGREGKGIFLDVGQSENLVERLKNHDRKNCWIKNSTNSISYYVSYIKNDYEKSNLEIRIRANYNIICGKR